MKRSTRFESLLCARSLLRAGAMIGLATLVPLYASCASEGDERDDTPKEDAAAIPDPDGLDAGDAGVVDGDAACDAGDPSCTTSMLTCESADWCPAQTGLDGRIGLQGIWGSSKTDVWAVGSAGNIVHFDGTAWKGTPSGTNQSLYAIWGNGPSDVWVTSTPGVTLHGSGYQSGAASWSLVTPPIADYTLITGSRGKLVTAVWGFSTGDVWFGGESFAPQFGDPQESQWRKATVDGGAGFLATSGCVKNGACPTVRALWGSAANDLWAVGNVGVTMHADTTAAGGGAPTWKQVDSQSTANLAAIWGAAGPAGAIWAVGDGGTIRRFVSGSARWEKVASPTTNTLHALWGASANDVWAVGELGTVLHYDGTSWTPSSVAWPLGTKAHLNGVWGSGPDDVWIVGDGIVLHFTGHKQGLQGDAR